MAIRTLRAGHWPTADDLNPQPWQDLELVNGWVWRNLAGDNFFVPGFRETKYGVQLIGTCYKAGGGTSGSAVALLPAGYRPTSEYFGAFPTNGTSPIIMGVYSTGYIIPIGTVPTTLHFNGLIPLTR